MKKNSKQGAEAFGNGLTQQSSLCDLSAGFHPCGKGKRHHPSGSKLQGFTDSIQVKLKWRFDFPEINTLGK